MYRKFKKWFYTKKETFHGEPIENAFLQNNFCLVPVALSNVNDCSTTMTFYQMSKDCGTSSLYRPISLSLGKISNTIKVPVYSLKHFFDIFDWNRFSHIEYIKIDAQGADLDIIKSAGDYLKDRVVYITAEPETLQYENISHNNINSMIEYLKTQGFIYIKHPNTIDPTFINSKYLHMKDSVYISQFG